MCLTPSTGQRSVASGALLVPGNHTVRVAISSAIYESLGQIIVGTLSQNFSVYLPIVHVELQAMTGSRESLSHAVLARDDTGNLTTGIINFYAR